MKEDSSRDKYKNTIELPAIKEKGLVSKQIYGMNSEVSNNKNSKVCVKKLQ
jgi:hypothetical protein